MSIKWSYLCGTNGNPIERCYIDPTDKFERWELTRVSKAGTIGNTKVFYCLKGKQKRYPTEALLLKAANKGKES